MIKSLSLKDEYIIQDIRNLFGMKNETKAIKERIIENLFEHEKEEVSFYKQVRVSNIWSNNCIE